MPSYRPCASCGEPRRVTPASAAAVLCRACRRRLCPGCGQPLDRAAGQVTFCSAACREAYQAQEVTAA